MIERRETSRRRVCFGGLVRPAAFLPGIACTLRDVSLDGARLWLAPGTTLPHRFELVVPCRGETRSARVVWREGDAVGLTFENAGPVAVAKADGVQDVLLRLRESEAEIARLRAALLRADEGPWERPH